MQWAKRREHECVLELLLLRDRPDPNHLCLDDKAKCLLGS